MNLLEGYRSELPFSLSYAELISLYLSQRLLQTSQAAHLRESFDSLLARIESCLPSSLPAFLRKLERALPSSPLQKGDYSFHGPLIEQITQAIMDRKTLEVQYYSLSRGRVQIRKIDPYRLWHQEGALHLIAYCHLRQRVLTFALGRIRAARPTSENFVLPEGFNFEEYVKDSFALLHGERVRVKILFSPHQAPWIAERLWHPSQKMQYQLDGSLLMSLEVTDSLELKRWILGFGKEAEVLEPKELREAIQQEANGLAERYSEAVRGPRKGPSKAESRTEPPKRRLRIEIL